ncbi:unnamed protein product [Meloidogyne enterolobii]|uniref:Uncharacterized protein n=1 Tax=Meloidogyne enterolobii TaxID=390850 RepID=A0ACB1A2V6_MELEN
MFKILEKFSKLFIKLNFMSNYLKVSWSTLTLSSVFFAAHFLVCFNSAANPVLYALINRELRQQHAQAFQKRRRSLHLITTNNTTAMTDKDLNSPTIAKLKEHRLASLGCTDDSRLMLLGNGLINGQHLENGQQLEKRLRKFFLIYKNVFFQDQAHFPIQHLQCLPD